MKHPIFTRTFWILCTGTVFFMSSFSMLLPELPGYLASMGGERYIGLIVGLFTANALLSRLVSSKMADEKGRIKVILIGTAVSAICGFAYLLVWSIWSFLALRFIHGMSTGFRPTGTTAFLSDIIHISRRGEAMGYLGVAGNAGMALGPTIGSLVRVHYGYEALFITSGVIGLIAYAMSLLLKETLPNPKPITANDFNIFSGKRVDFASWPAALILLPVAFAFGVFLTVSPDFVGNLGYTYRGSFNTIIVVSSISTRLFAGRASDRHGRIPLLIMGAFLLAAGMGVIAMAEDRMTAAIGGVIYGISIGINMPTIFAWTVDFARKGKTALALGTMLISLELGIGLGALISGTMYGGQVENIPMTYWMTVFVGVLGAFVLIIFRNHPAFKAAPHTDD